jgi:hypothetical protein
MDQKPSLGRIVLVKTHERLINAQDEHAAIVTQVFADDCVNVLVFPGAGEMFAVGSVRPAHEGQTKGHSWRWPPRV